MNFKLILLSVLLTVSLSKKVKIEIYSESLCPYCIDFYTNSFKEAIQTPEFYKIFDFEIYPYGNASQEQNGDQWEFECQHGPNECYGNTIEACADHYHLNEVTAQYVICLSQKAYKLDLEPDFDVIGSECADKVGIDWNQIHECANGDQGNHLQHVVADATENLNPPKDSVPWITVNGKYDEEEESELLVDLLQFVCKKYDGDEKIEACKEHAGNNQQQSGQNQSEFSQVSKVSQKYKNKNTQKVLNN